MYQKYQEFVMAINMRTTISPLVLNCCYSLEFVQNLGLFLPNLGWGTWKYSEGMLNSVKTISQFILLTPFSMSKIHTDSKLIFEIGIIIILFTFFSVYFIQKFRKMINKTNLALYFILNIFWLPILNFYIQQCYLQYYLPLGIFGILLIFILRQIIVYYQRNISINYYQEQLTILQRYNKLMHIHIILDLIKIIFHNNQSNSIYFVYLFGTFNMFDLFLLSYVNQQQDNDPSKLRQAFISCLIGINLLFLIFLIINVNESNIFHFTLLIVTPIFHLGRIKSLFQIQDFRKQFGQLILTNEFGKELHINFKYSIIEQHLKDLLQKQQNEDILLAYIDFLFNQKQLYYTALTILYEQEPKLKEKSIFYIAYINNFKYIMKKAIQNLNQSSIEIQQLNVQQQCEEYYREQFTIIINLQIDYFNILIQGAQDQYELEFQLQRCAAKSLQLNEYFKKHDLLNIDCAFIYLRIQQHYYYNLIQDYTKATISFNKMIHMIKADSNKNYASQIHREKAIMLEVSIINHHGFILNRQKLKNMNKFFGFESDIQLENILQLMPQQISKLHYKFIQRYLNKNQQQNNTTTLVVLQQQQSGIVQPIEISFTISSNQKDMIFIALFRLVNQQNFQILFDNQGIILGISQNFDGIDNLFDQLDQYRNIIFFIPEIFQLINNQTFNQDFTIEFRNPVQIQKIYEYFQNNIYKENNCYLDNPQFQEEVLDLLDSEQVLNYNDKLYHFKCQLSKIEFENTIVQYQLELMTNFTHQHQEIVEENELQQILAIDAKSHRGSLIGSSQDNVGQLLHQEILKNDKQHNIMQIYRFSVAYILGMLMGMTIIYFVLAYNHQQMSKYIGYLQNPIIINNIFCECISFSLNSYLFEEIEISDYIQNQFNNAKLQLYNSLTSTVLTLQNILVDMESQGYRQELNLTYYNKTRKFTDYSDLIIITGENIFSLINNNSSSTQFVQSALFFRLNLIKIFTFTQDLVLSFINYLNNFSDLIKLQWLIVTVGGIIGLVAPQLLYTYYWYKQELVHRGLIQIMGRLTEEKAIQIAKKKQNLIQVESENQYTEFIQKSYRSIQTVKSKLITTENNQNLHIKEKTYLYERIKKKRINIKFKIVLGIFLYLLVFIVFIMGNETFIINSDSYAPIQGLLQNYIQFQMQIETIITMAQMMKTQNLLINALKQVHLNYNTTEVLINDFELTQSFQSLFKTYSKKTIAMFSQVVLSDVISESDKNILFNLYKSDFCIYLKDEIPFCQYLEDLTVNEFTLKYGEFDWQDNNKKMMAIGIIGYVSQLQSLLKNNYNEEITNGTYATYMDNEIFLQQEYNNLIIQYHSSGYKGFDLFFYTIRDVAIKTIQYHQDVMQYYCIGCMGGYALIFSIIQFTVLYRAKLRYTRAKYALTILPLEVLQDRNNLYQLKLLNK